MALAVLIFSEGFLSNLKQLKTSSPKMTNSITKITLFPYEGISIKTFCGFGHMISNGTLSHFELISNFQLVEHKRIMSLGRK